MDLVRLIYTSTITEQFDIEDIARILKVARLNNKTLNVTGLLSFNRQFFLQCLEGTRQNVNQIYHKIATDPRHKRPEIIAYQAISKREFDSWNMGYLQNTESLRELFYQHTRSINFDPYKMNEESAKSLLLDIRDEIKRAEAQ
ncbi:BLUF domain-containing protein [Marinomonas rhizomae]|uniref:FAD-dependent sensor of blue light n=1 Tax=Marinomonas rhizomae TaxID=491948 RepID=A0A366JCV6_9GAMM|nr:BLUF domain-containing protein [Marinomonas rhizomae]RBP84240.1 FAD-dependent sensor of blue light [Marinomonas rhizomae]RNF74562.1 BLUF domain-containing protein [Marinomonas rhizomae]